MSTAIVHGLRGLAAAVALFALAPVYAAEAPSPDSRYQWDLTELYPTVDAWEAERERLLAEVPKLEKFKGTLGASPQSLRDGLDAISAVGRSAARLGTYAGLAADADQRVSAAVERRALARKLDNDIGKALSWQSNEILAIGAPTIERYIAAEPGLAKHAVGLRKTLRNAPHTLGNEGEHVMAATSELRGDGERIYELLSNADITWPTIKLADGTDAKLTSSGYTKYRQVTNRADRKAVFDNFFGVYNTYQDSMGAALYAQVKGHVFSAQMRKHPSALTAALHANNVPEAVYRTLVTETNAGLPVLYRYFGLRKKLLGITDDMRYYDIYPPMFGLKKNFTIEDTKAIVLAAMAPLGRDYVGTLREAVNARWMSVYPADGKQSGAYMNPGAYDVHPYLLLNHNDDYGSLSTFAHEWGHGMHSLLAARAQPYETADYPIFTAEIASITNEFLLNDDMVAKAKTKDEKLFYLGQALESIRGTLYRQTMFAEFELAIHEAVEKGEALTGEKLTTLYCGLLKRYHGHDQGVLKIDDAYCPEWAFIPHFYYNFYVYQYSTSMAAAAYFAGEVKKGAKQRENYLDVLRAGGSDFPYEVLKRAGLDMASPAPYRALIARMDRIIGEIEKLAAQPG